MSNTVKMPLKRFHKAIDNGSTFGRVEVKISDGICSVEEILIGYDPDSYILKLKDGFPPVIQVTGNTEVIVTPMDKPKKSIWGML